MLTDRLSWYTLLMQRRLATLAVVVATSSACLIDFSRFDPIGSDGGGGIAGSTSSSNTGASTTGAGGDGGGGAPPARRCAKIERLRSTFDEELSGDELSNSADFYGLAPRNGLEQTGGELVLTGPAARSFVARGISSRRRFDFEGSSVSIRAPQPSTSGQVEVRLAIVESSNQTNPSGYGKFVAIRQQGETIEAIQGYPEIFEATTIGAPFDFSEPDHRVWRIREDGGELHFEVSADGGDGSWAPITEPVLWRSALDRLNDLRIDIELRADFGSSMEVTVRLDDLNVTPGPSDPMPWCSIETFRDDFEAGALAPRWIEASYTPCASTPDGQLELEGTCRLESGAAFDMDGGSVAIRPVTLPATGRVVFLLKDASNGPGAAFEYEDGTLDFNSYVAGSSEPSTIASTSVDSTEHAYWRFRLDAEHLYFETSPTGDDGDFGSPIGEPVEVSLLDLPLDPSAIVLHLRTEDVASGMRWDDVRGVKAASP